MTSRKDYYEVLGVPRTATEKDLKSAYRRLAKKLHPDVTKNNKQAEERFKDVAEAFAVLSDPEKRAKYDRGGHEAFEPGFDPFAGFDPGRYDSGVGDISSLFEMFGLGARGGSARRARRGQDLHYELQIPFVDAVRGRTLEVSIPRQAPCSACGGQGLRPGTRGEPCPTCRGAGSVASDDRIRVRIPVGVEHGATLRLPGQGHAGTTGGRRGDAFLLVNVQPDPVFRREGRDLVCDVSVGLARAALGGPVEVPTLEGSAKIQVPPGTRSGQRLRLRDRGVPAAAGEPAGDLHVVIQIQPPARLDERSRQLMEEFQQLNPVP